jgi:hypothetical protein
MVEKLWELSPMLTIGIGLMSVILYFWFGGPTCGT